VLAYLIDRGLNTYTQVAATLQAYINDPDTILALMATERLEASLEDLREMESVLIDVDPEHEELVPRPDPDKEGQAVATKILESAEDLFEEYRGRKGASISDALDGMLELPTGGDSAEPQQAEQPEQTGAETDQPGEDTAPVADTQTTDKPTTDEESTGDVVADEESTVDEPTVDESTGNESTVNESTVDGSATDDSTRDELAEESAVDKPDDGGSEIDAYLSNREESDELPDDDPMAFPPDTEESAEGWSADDPDPREDE